MTARVLIASLSLLAIPAGFAASPPGASAEAKFKLKPGAKGKVCLGCHLTFEDTLKLPSVHTPVKAGECSNCHSPHASDHGKLLAQEPADVCFACHGDILPAGAKSAHRSVVEGECAKCHDPHAAPFKKNLLLAGNQLCLSCHKELGTALATNAFKHGPVEQNCLGCHDPHASTGNAMLLKQAVPGLCTGCHKPDQPFFVKAHVNYAVGKSDCTSCHDPHGSKNRGILWATAHPPVVNKMCGQCHPEPSAANALMPKKEGIDLCRGCHSEAINQIFTASRVHWPVLARRGCLSCHTPHAAKTKGLLPAGQTVVCGSCHSATIARQARSVTKHEPVEQGNCSVCHAPHASDTPSLFTRNTEMETCGICHDWQGHSAHPIGEKAIDPRNPNLTVGCSSCHRNHGTEFKHFTPFDMKMDLCVQCHKDMRR